MNLHFLSSQGLQMSCFADLHDFIVITSKHLRIAMFREEYIYKTQI